MHTTVIVNHSVPFPGLFVLTAVPSDPENQRSYLMDREELLVLQSRVNEALDTPTERTLQLAEVGL